MEPTEWEQYQVEIINRARANPLAEVARLQGETWGDNSGGQFPKPQGANLNEGSPRTMISSDPKQPLAIEPILQETAGKYVELLLANEAVVHDWGGTTPSSRAKAAGYPGGIAENFVLTTVGGPNPINVALVQRHYRDLFVDNNIAGRGHRTNLMDPRFSEIGLAIRPDSDKQSALGSLYSSDVMTVQDFGAPGRTQITGVIYHDKDGDGFYTPGKGEALGGVLVEAWANGAKVASTTAFSSGGYSLQVSNGEYQVRFISSNGVALGQARVQGANVKLDAINPLFVPSVIAGPVSGQNGLPPPRIGLGSGQMSLYWDPLPAGPHTLESSANLKDWSTLRGLAEGQTSYSESINPGTRFFRIRPAR